MKIFLLFYMCHFANGLTHCYKTAGFYRATRMHSTDYAVEICLSVRPSVRHMPVLSLNGCTYPQTFFIVG